MSYYKFVAAELLINHDTKTKSEFVVQRIEQIKTLLDVMDTLVKGVHRFPNARAMSDVLRNAFTKLAAKEHEVENNLLYVSQSTVAEWKVLRRKCLVVYRTIIPLLK